MSKATVTLTLLLSLLSAGCSTGLGQRCTSNEDCQAPLRCLPVTKASGICSYAPLHIDASLHAQDGT
ncbi:MAG: hypothetical protein JRH20_11120 [Deltaproteobacteria bacterium]|nr:hypothetical protein [Deltaproteobacteria bacterium]